MTIAAKKNITESKQAEEELQESEEQYKTLVEDAPIGIYFIDFRGTFLYGNKKAEEITGYQREELLGKSFLNLKLLDLKELSKATKLLALNKLGKATGPDRFVLNRKDGAKSIVEIRSRITTFGGKKVVIGMVEDVTERKQAEEALQAEKNKLQSVIEAMSDGLSIQDKDFNIIYQNEPSRIGAGRDCTGEKCYQAYENRETVCDGCPVKNAFKDSKSHTAERSHVSPSGEVTFWENTASPIRDSVGNIVSCLEITRDITERKQAEQVLDDEATRRRILVDQSRDGIVVLDQNGKVYEANQRFAEMLGYTPEEVAELYVWDWDTQWSHEELLEQIQEVDAAGGRFETCQRRKDGTTIDVEISTNGAVVAGQKLVFCVCRDITERKQAEDKIEKAEQEKADILDSMNELVIFQDLEHRMIWVNKVAAESVNLPLDQLVGKHCYEVWPQRSQPCVGCPVAKARQSGKAEETEIATPDGRVWSIRGYPMRDANGSITSLLEVTLDITERKQAEQVLADEATRRRILVDQSRDGIVILDQNGKVYESNQHFAEMLGYTLEETAELHVWDWEYQYPPEQVLEMIRTVDEAGDHFETQHKRKDGSVYDVEISTNGAVVAGQKLIFCVCRNITERKKAEERLRSILKTALDGFWLTNLEGKVLEVNDSYCKMVGYTREELLKMSTQDIEAIENPEEVAQHIKRIIEQGYDSFETRHRRKDGKIIDVEVSVNYLDVGEEQLFIFARDITERKQTEEALRESEERYRAVIEEAHDMIQSVALDGSINFVNQAWLDALGYTKEDLPHLNLFNIIHPDSLKHCQEMFAGVVSGKPAHNIQATFSTKDGRKILIEGNAAPRYIGDTVVATQGIFRDITERKQMEGQLQEKNEQLDAQNEELRIINEELQATEEELQHSQERLERMFESVTDGIVVATLDGTILKANQRAAQIHGFASEEKMLGRSAFDLVAPRDHERIGADIRKALKEGLIIGGEYTLLRVDGAEFPGELSASALKDGRGNVIGHISISRDITERKQMEKLFKTVTNSSQVGIYILQGRKFQMANPQFQKLTGYTEEELVGMDSLALVLDEDRDMVRKKAIKMLNGERSSPYQFRVLNKAGETRWVMETVTSIPYRGGRAILGNYMDITERRQAEEREKQLEQELNLAGRLASIGQLAAGVAHEINNPLTGVIGFSHLMLNRDIPDDMKQDLQVIHSEAQRVAKIVENLLVFAHQRKPGREYVNINEIINRVLELRAYEMKVNNIYVENQLAPDLPSTMADAGQLQQVFLNIVLNAEHFIAKANNKGKLLVKTEKIGSNIRASFTDNGAGISPENLDKIFNPFFTTKDVGDGTGLGLSICHGIITQHQGHIYTRSQPGKGATFVIELPVVALPAQPVKAKEIKKEPRKPRGAKILVVDDEVAILVFLKRLLTEWGHRVETINNANKALERLKTERYSLILLDIKLPGMSGIELYHHIEETVPALTRRVIFITGDVMQSATRSFLEKTGVPHITKPVDIEVLKKMINRALNQAQVAAKAPG